MDVSDVAKMNVAQLKAELEKRNLPSTGKKAELSERLVEAIRKEEEILNLNDVSGTASGGESVDDSILLNQQGDDDLLSDPAETKAAKPEEKIASPTNGAEKSAAPVARARISSTEEDSKEAKIRRAQRFGIPIGTPLQNTVASDDAKKKRAERFGLSSTNNTNTQDAVTSEDAKAKRAARFGITTSNAGATHIGSGLNKNLSDEQREKLLKRAQRFGIPVGGEGKRAAPVDSEIEARKKARLERFGAM